MGFSEEKHTEPGLSDSASDGLGQVTTQQALMKIEFGFIHFISKV